MIYIRSLLVGLAALILYLLLCSAILWRVLIPKLTSFPADNVSYVFESPWIPIWPFLSGAVLIFAAAFYWTFKRSSKTLRPPR